MTKLYTIGYNVGDRVMFGTDASADDYSTEWTKAWLETDTDILYKIGVSKENMQKLYYDNLLRFLGKTDVKSNMKALCARCAQTILNMRSVIVNKIKDFIK